MAGTQNQIGLASAYGNAYTPGTTLTVTSTPQELKSGANAWVLDGNSVGFSLSSDGRLTYTGNKTRWFMASGWIITGISSVTLTVTLRKNGSISTNAGSSMGNSGSGLYMGPQLSIFQLATNDYLSLFVSEASGSNSSSISAQMAVFSVSN